MGVYFNRLPSTYQEVEYIESSGAQYINTGYTHTANTKVNLGFSITQNTSDWQFLFGQRTSYQQPTALDLAYLSTNGKLGFKMGTSTTYDSFSSISLNTKYEILMTPTETWLSNGATASFNKVLQAGSGPCYLFWCNAEFSGLKPYAKIYFCKIYDGDTLVRNFIPCYRKSDNVIGMYDLVNSVFYTNAGTGTFTKGNNVVGLAAIKNAYVGDNSGGTLEISYNLRSGTLAGLQSAGFDELWTNGGYSFTSDGLQQTSSSNDRGIWIIKRGLDLTNAKKLIAYSVGRWQYDSWSNGKEVKLGTAIPTGGTMTNPRRDTYFTYSNNSGYRNSEIPYINASGTSTVLASGIAISTNGADDTITLTIDFENKTIEWKVTGSNNYTLSANLSNEQYNATRNMTAIYWGWGRGYHTYDAYERLKEVYLKIEI